MIKQTRILFSMILACLFIQITVVQAGDEQYRSSLRGEDIAIGEVLDLEDSWYSYMQNNSDWEEVSGSQGLSIPFDRTKRFSNVGAMGYVGLRWENSAGIIFDERWSYRVTVSVKAWGSDGSFLGTITQPLEIDYVPGHGMSFKDHDILKIPRAYKLSTSIQKIEFSENGGNYVPQTQIDARFGDLFVENSIMLDRYHSMDLETTFQFVRQNLSSTDNRATYAWEHIEGAEEYDLEWLYVPTSYLVDGVVSTDLINWEEATRVTLTDNHYEVELPYEEGDVLFRVRAVGFANQLHQRIYTGWMDANQNITIREDGSGDIYPYEGGLDDDKNWTYSAQYAEQGKRSEAISFFDGTGRGRQAITKDNANDEVMVSETVFDHEGRQAISVFPSHSGSDQMRFYDDYTLNQAGDIFGASDFDNDSYYADPTTIEPLNNTIGAGQYYNNSNPLSSSYTGAYIPDAEGFPYTRTVFDNQGRVASTAGAGGTFKYGSGQEVEYYYGTAAQELLDRLFGAEVGYAEHYRMKAVKDPNGQISISYENLAGQVIATALIGQAPIKDNVALLDDLDVNGYDYATDRNIDIDLGNFNAYELEGDPSWTVSRELTFLTEDSYHFDYDFTAGAFNHICATGDCAYTLEFHLYSADGQELALASTEPYFSSSTGQSNLSEAFAVANGASIEFDLQVGEGDLVIGSYYIEKRLTLINTAAQREVFVAELEAQYADWLAGNPPTGTNCINFDDYIVNIDLECEIWGEDDVDMSTIVDMGENYCSGLLATLAGDMSPGGQYFDNTVNASNPNGWLLDVANGVGTVGSYNFMYSDGYGTYTAQTWDEVRTYWEDDWALDLVIYHPEYCHYENHCVPSPTWYEEVQNFNLELSLMTWTEALAAGYVAEDGSGNPSCPYPGSCPLSAYIGNNPSGQLNIISNYALLQNDPVLSSVKGGIVDRLAANNTWTIALNAWTAGGSTNKDELWTMFINMYIGAKTKAMDTYHVVNTGCNFLQAAGDDIMPTTSDGFAIRVINQGALEADLLADGGTASSAAAFGNDIVQDYSLCGQYDISVNMSNYNSGDYELTLQNMPSGFPSPLVSFRYANTNTDLASLQATMDAAVAALPAPYNEDITILVTQEYGEVVIHIQMIAEEVTTQINNGQEEIITQVLTTYTSANAELYLTPINGGSSLVQSYNGDIIPCDDIEQPICICEDMDGIIAWYQDDPTLCPNNPDGTVPWSCVADYYNTAYQSNFTANNIADIYAICKDTSIDAPTRITEIEAILNVVLPKAAIAIAYPEYSNLVCWNQEPNGCEAEEQALSAYYTDLAIQEAIQEQADELLALYIEGCMGGETAPDQWNMNYIDRSFHYTLYYYDAAGNLTRTVPPTGVRLLDQVDMATVAIHRNAASNDPIRPDHVMETHYLYNTLGQNEKSYAPDRGYVETYYDYLARPVITVDAQQRVDGEASYVLYDELGRVKESGVLVENGSFNLGVLINDPTLMQSQVDLGFPIGQLTGGQLDRIEVRRTYYDEIPSTATDIATQFYTEPSYMRNNVAMQEYLQDGSNIDYQAAYSYDALGNVGEMWQYQRYMPGKHYTQMLYDFDLISGVVHEVKYQPEQNDQITYQYSYDANNRLTKARSSINGYIWHTDAKYEYYLHGPLRRMEIGHDKVQAMDYVYNLQGWIKSVNSTTLSENRDPGRDGNSNSTIHGQADIHANVGRDIFGYGVHYFENKIDTIPKYDYRPIGNIADVDLPVAQIPSFTGLYNGNISNITKALTKPAVNGGSQTPMEVIWKNFRYDQLNRLTEEQNQLVDLATLTTSNNWGTANFGNKYRANYTYGPNGNILSLNRYDDLGGQIDQFTYNYDNGIGGTVTAPRDFVNNKLIQVEDATVSNADYDMESQPISNYSYNADGSLITDISEEIETIIWTNDNKVKELIRTTSSTKPDLEYVYDLQGNRAVKIVKHKNSSDWDYTVYNRDAQGNIIAIYERTQPQSSGTTLSAAVYLKEQHLYGSSRVGMIERNLMVAGSTTILGNGKEKLVKDDQLDTEFAINSYLWNQEYGEATYTASSSSHNPAFQLDLATVENVAIDEVKDPIYTTNATTLLVQRLENIRGKRRYELSNFRGDVQQVVSDIRIGVEGSIVDNQAEYFTADVLKVEDAYGFGWQQPNRHFSLNADYRFNFNGQEEDNDLLEASLVYTYRTTNTRIARFFAVDPIAAQYPELTPYQIASNSPIYMIELEGLEGEVIIDDQTSVIVFITGLGGLSGDSGSSGSGSSSQGSSSQGGRGDNSSSNDLSQSRSGSSGADSDMELWIEELAGVMDLNVIVETFPSSLIDGGVKTEVETFVGNNLGENGRLVVIGYSWGGDTALELSEEGVLGIDLLITIDPADGPFVETNTTAGTATRAINFFQPNPQGFTQSGNRFVTGADNRLILEADGGEEIDHMNIYGTVIDEVVREAIDEVAEN